MTRRRHGWLVEALETVGYHQHDLASAWKVDDAVVSRFITSDKPDLTPQRLMLLSQILGISNDELLQRLYGDEPMPRIIKPPVPRQEPVVQNVVHLPTSTNNAPSGEEDNPHLAVTDCIEQLKKCFPGANIKINISYGKGHD